MTSKIIEYNNALMLLEERKLASLSENREARRVLDDAWDSVTGYCLAQGVWNFAMRAIQASALPSVDPTFGYQFSVQKPADWVSTFLVSTSENFDPPLLQYTDEAGFWYVNSDPVYVKYVSSDAAYGGDLSLWTEPYADYVATRLAMKCCKRITGSNTLLDPLMKAELKARKVAMSRDAMDEPPISPPRGTWVRSRIGGSSLSGTGRGL